MTTCERRGVCCAGNWIVDHIIEVDEWPREEWLSLIDDEERAPGGPPYHVGVCLQNFELDIPVSGVGLVGDGEDGRLILDACESAGIDSSRIRPVEGSDTAKTFVVSPRRHTRTFFHRHGASAKLGPEDFGDLGDAKILTIGYMDLLPGLDTIRGDRAGMSLVLEAARDQGLMTVVDCVTRNPSRLREISRSCLQHVDYLVLNEIEAQLMTHEVPPGQEPKQLSVAELEAIQRAAEEPEAIQRSARDLVGMGVKRAVVVHSPKFAVAATEDGVCTLPGHVVEEEDIKGSLGAGDAFLAGFVAGVHSEWPIDECLEFAHGTAASSLRSVLATQSVGSVGEIKAFIADHGRRTLV